MFRRLLTIGLIMAGLLAGRVTAKPPDLPLPQNDVLAPLTQPGPAEATPYVFPQAAEPATEAPLFFRVRPSVRRTMASCLLFGAHPLLALAPTEEYVDFDEEDTQPGTIQALFDLSPWDNEPCDVVSGHGFTGGRDAATNVSSGCFRTTRMNEPDDPRPSVCPWMRQQQCDPPAPRRCPPTSTCRRTCCTIWKCCARRMNCCRPHANSDDAGRVLDALGLPRTGP